MSQSLIGFLRGIAYVVVFAIFDYISKNLGASGIASPAVATFITAIIASFEHYLNDPAAPTTA